MISAGELESRLQPVVEQRESWGNRLKAGLQRAARRLLSAALVRIQIPTATPVFLHLDEVEIYGPEDPRKNLALGRPADQSSRSPWSRGGPLFTVGGMEVALAKRGTTTLITANGAALPADRAQIHRENGRTTLEIALPFRDPPAEFAPYHGRPFRLAVQQRSRIVWGGLTKLGYGRNRLSFEIQSEDKFLPAELIVETIVFTPQRLEREVVSRRRLEAPGIVPIEFQLRHEGAAAVIATLRQGETELRDGRAFFIPPLAETLNCAALLRGKVPNPAQRLESRL